MNAYTTASLIDDILLLSHLPLGNNTYTAAKILRLADFELQTPIMKQILSTRGGYYLTFQDYAPVSTGIYALPSDAVMGTLEHVELVQADTRIPVSAISPNDQYSGTVPSISAYGYYLRGNYVVMLPADAVGTVRLWFSKRPSQMIVTTQAAQVSAIAGAVITVSTLPSTIIVGSVVDVLGDQPPFHILEKELTVTAITGTDVTLSAPVTTLSVGDWIAPTNQTPIPQLPVEYRILLMQRVVVKIYEANGYLDKMKAAQMKLQEYEKDTLNLITPRVKSSTKIVHPNGGFLRRNRWG